MSLRLTQLIKIPPLHKLRRALRHVSRRGFVGACVWCGHGYRRFSLQIESAHLKQCAGYQKAEQRPENLQREHETDNLAS